MKDVITKKLTFYILECIVTFYDFKEPIYIKTEKNRKEQLRFLKNSIALILHQRYKSFDF